ncbi:MAG: hypothetical protein GQ526_10735 [Ardenticatenales bacterium]|nr:hypothetical protein [Ardenticatenales bacterium]
MAVGGGLGVGVGSGAAVDVGGRVGKGVRVGKRVGVGSGVRVWARAPGGDAEAEGERWMGVQVGGGAGCPGVGSLPAGVAANTAGVTVGDAGEQAANAEISIAVSMNPTVILPVIR